jgi:hypothetical protein
MNNLLELLLGLLLILLSIGQPTKLQELTHTTLGKIIFLVATACATMKSLWAGITIALIYIILHNGMSLIETMENENEHHDDDDADDYHNDALKKRDNNCDCDDEECDVSDGKERMTVDEALRPQESNAIPV